MVGTGYLLHFDFVVEKVRQVDDLFHFSEHEGQHLAAAGGQISAGDSIFSTNPM